MPRRKSRLARARWPLAVRVFGALAFAGALALPAVAAARPLSTKVTERVVDSAVDTALEALAEPENQRRLATILSSTAVTGGVHDITYAVVDGVFDGLEGRVKLDLDTKTFWKDFDQAMRKHVAPAVNSATRGAVDAALAAALSEENGVRVEAFAAHATHGVIKGLSQGIREDLGPALAHMIVHDLAPAGATAMEHEIMPAFARALSAPPMQAAIAGTMSSVARNLVRGGDAGMETAKAEAEAEGKVGALGVFGDRLSMGLGVVVVAALAFAGVLILLVVLLLRSNRGQQRLVVQGKQREDELLAVVEELDHTSTDFDAAKLRELLKQHIRAR